MGTSKGYIAPTRPEWSKAKRAVSSYLKNKNTKSKMKAVSKFAEARRIRGTSATIGSTSFSSAVGNIIVFAKNVNDNGLDKALNQSGLNDLVGKPTEDIVHELIEYFANHGSTAEDSLSLAALSYALEILKIETPDDLATMDINAFLLEVIIAFINYDFDFHFSEKINKGRTAKEASDILEDVHGYIDGTLRSRLTFTDIKKIDWSKMDAEIIVSKMLDDAFTICMTFYEVEE